MTSIIEKMLLKLLTNEKCKQYAIKSRTKKIMKFIDEDTGEIIGIPVYFNHN